MLEPETDCV